MSADETRRRRLWADLIAIVASVIALGNAMWGPIIFTTMFGQLQRGDPGVGYNWFAFGIGGLAGVLGVGLAQRRPSLGRPFLIFAGLLLAVTPFFYQHRPLLPILTSVILGVAMLAVAPFVGPMPRGTRREVGW